MQATSVNMVCRLVVGSGMRGMRGAGRVRYSCSALRASVMQALPLAEP